MNKIIIGIIMAIILVAGIIVGFFLANNQNIQIANPASVNCEKQNGSLEIITSENGAQLGICKFEDGTECEEWTLMRKECKMGDTKAASVFKTCSTDSDCIPLPSECHTHTCINQAYTGNFIHTQLCTMMFDSTAAYNPEDCSCTNKGCVDKNLK